MFQLGVEGVHRILPIPAICPIRIKRNMMVSVEPVFPYLHPLYGPDAAHRPEGIGAALAV